MDIPLGIPGDIHFPEFLIERHHLPILDAESITLLGRCCPTPSFILPPIFTF